MSSSAPPPDGDADQGPVLLTVVAVSTALALIAFGLRLFVRIRIVRGVGRDDYVLGAAAALAVVVMAFEIKAVSSGLGRHAFFLDHHEEVEASMWSRAAVPTNLAASLLARVSFGLFLLRIVDRRRGYKIFLWVFITFTTVTTFATIINSLVRCRPLAKIWDHDLPGECSPQRIAVIVGAVQAAAAISSDWAVALFPIVLLKDLNMARKTKIALGILMGLGVFVGAAALIKTLYLYTLATRPDVTWDVVPLTCWSIIEQNVGILAVSIPATRPLFRRVFRIGSSAEKQPPYLDYDLPHVAGRENGPMFPAAVYSISTHEPAAEGNESEFSLVRETHDGGITKTVSVSLQSHVYHGSDRHHGGNRDVERGGSWFKG